MLRSILVSLVPITFVMSHRWPNPDIQMVWSIRGHIHSSRTHIGVQSETGNFWCFNRHADSDAEAHEPPGQPLGSAPAVLTRVRKDYK